MIPTIGQFFHIIKNQRKARAFNHRRENNLPPPPREEQNGQRRESRQENPLALIQIYVTQLKEAMQQFSSTH